MILTLFCTDFRLAVLIIFTDTSPSFSIFEAHVHYLMRQLSTCVLVDLIFYIKWYDLTRSSLYVLFHFMYCDVIFL